MRRTLWVSSAVTCLLACSSCKGDAAPGGEDLPDDVLPWGSEAAPAARVEACAVAPTPSPYGGLGVDLDAFVGCLEALLGASGMPAEVVLPFKREGDRLVTLESRGLMKMSVVLNAEGKVSSLDAVFSGDLREKHGYDPELKAQYALLAALVPSAGADLKRGEALFETIDARGRARNTSRIVSTWDGVEVASSFQPVSVMYQLRAASASERAAE